MAPHPTRVSQPRRDRTIPAQLASLSDRLEAAEYQQRQLKNTVAALGSEIGVSVGCPCGRCNESYTLIKAGSMYCPRCGYRESL
ncbi:hypothetical protein [Natrinema versiforme]|uniref:Uncharacterized protein n=1 Tax=Natrinema versiforme JCM 10478 TaxID=1227496 RepID=L9XVC3_9EURY|nr:hypothetical protein [Natrinema versiforme]ELY64548.1 hypothetical protein C489_17384 [Natrinema versiforme JCM 10478]